MSSGKISANKRTQHRFNDGQSIPNTPGRTDPTNHSFGDSRAIHRFEKEAVDTFYRDAGIYLTYWFYRNWRLHKQSTGENLWPVPRALFSVFFVHALFRIANQKRDRGPAGLQKWKHGQHATIIVLLLLSGNIADRLSSRSIGTPITSYLSLLLLIPIATCIAAAQDKINEACGDPHGESNSRFTGANYAWIFIGVLIWILIGIGIFMPAPSA